jgi:hypothetical protein
MKWIKTDKELAQFTEVVKAAMNSADSTAGSVASPSTRPDVMEQLRKLGDLRAAGVLEVAPKVVELRWRPDSDQAALMVSF